MGYPLNQSAWRRGWNDTKTVWTSWQFFVLDGVVGVVIGSICQWYWGLGVVLFGMICAWLAVTISAPVRQRNEARHLLSEIPSKRKIIADKLAEFYLSGNDLKLRIVEEGFNEDAISLVRDWSKPLMDYCYAEPDMLGESSIVALSPKSKDWEVYKPSGLPDNERDYVFRHLSIQLDKLLDLVMELRK